MLALFIVLFVLYFIFGICFMSHIDEPKNIKQKIIYAIVCGPFSWITISLENILEPFDKWYKGLK